MSERACASCGTANESDAHFCEGCGTVLERTCGACGVAASATARFCRSCGAALDGKPTTAQAGPTRKTVTVMFADLAGSTAFEEIVDAETAREVIGRYHDLLRATAERHRAGVIKYIGDGFMAVWGVPEIGPDDAEQAVEAAIELQEQFVALASRVAEVHGVDLALRVAVNTGEVVVGADDADLVGDALNVGARLESECPHGQVVVGEETWRSTRGRHRYDPLGRVQVKGRSSPVAVYKWSGRSTESSDSVAFVGRADELRRIQTVFDDAVDNAAARLITIIGDPGVGKSRLAAEFISAHSGARIVRANCAVEGTPALTPIVELLRSRDIEADVPVGTPEQERIVRALTGMAAGVAGSVEETFWALRRFAEILAAERPLIIVFDDIHWADSLLLDFIEHLAEWARGVPVLMIALARPELRETRPELVTVGGCVTEAVRLSGLEPSATAELAAQVLGSEQLPVDLLGRLPSSTGGNPLFVRELVGMLVHDGVLVPRPDGWRLTVDVDAIAIPPTIQALLASRLERLNAADRRVLEVASVVGTDFSPAAVCALTGLGRAETKAALDRLRRHDLAQPTGTYSGDEPVWRFHHVLIRDVAYRRLLKSDRAELHERLADWAPADGARPALHSDEMVARHLEAAVGYRRDLGMRDEHTAELALRSARSYLASARRALDRDELLSAGTQAARGAAIAAGDATLQAELLLIGCEAFLSAGDVAAGAPLVDELEHVAGESLAPWAICYRCQLIAYTDPSRLLEADERLQGAIDEFSRRKDTAGLAKAHRVRASARGRLGRIGDSEIDLFEALIAARQCGDHRQITAALGAAPNAALWGPSPAPKAGGRCLDVVRMQRMTTAAPSLEATSLRCLAVLELLRGRADKARTMLAEARQVVADLGLRHGLMETELFAGIIEMMVGDPVAAEPHFRTALEGLDALGVGADAGQAAALLARSVLAQGRIDEADRYAAQSERIAGHNLKTAIAWRAVRGEILSAQGEHEAAIAKAREAVAVAAETDLVLDHADACLALSRVLAAAGDAPAAQRARSDAKSLYAAKDAVFMVGRNAEAVPAPATQPSAQARTSRLVIRNRATAAADAAGRAMQTHDADAAVALYSEGVVHDDHRRLRGNPIVGIDGLRVAVNHRIAQYPHVEWRHLAVRGETLGLAWFQWRDDAGNVSTSLDVFEVGDDDLIAYHARFDEDDFEGAYWELENRYYAGEGAPFAENGRTVCAWVDAVARRDMEAARRVSWPDFRWLASASSLKPEERTVDQFFDWLDERAQQLSSMRGWSANMQWLSPNCFVRLNEIQGLGAEGDEYRWEWIHVGEYRDGLASSVREFDVEDEDAAFAYAESLVKQRNSRLVVANSASRALENAFAALQANDASAVTGLFSAAIVYEDRRPLAGALQTGVDYLNEVVPALLGQYDHFELRILAVRGDRLCLAWSRWSDAAGNEATNLHVTELGEGGLIVRLVYFVGDDFWSAYRELENRYYAGEGAEFAKNGRAACALVDAMNALDAEAARQLCQPDFGGLSTVPTLVDPVRSIDEVVVWWRQRAEKVESIRNWNPVITWLSPDIAVSRGEARGISSDGAEYAWSNLYVGTSRDGLAESICAFELDDEGAAFAYAESLLARRQSRLKVSNRASVAVDGVFAGLRAKDGAATAEFYAERITYDDRRSLPGVPMTSRAELREAASRAVLQYNNFESRTLAVRGDRLTLTRSRWSDDNGNQSNHLQLFELDHEGLIAYEGRFDEDDFWSAYRELETRYYAGEGTPYAESGRASADWVIAISNGDIDGVRRVCHPDFRWIATPSALKDAERTVDDMFRWMQERGRQVSSQRHWVPVLHWLSSDYAVGLGEIEGIGTDGEEYSWSFIYVGECRDGLLVAVREFDDEVSAFAYAEGHADRHPSRLALSNSASRIVDQGFDAMRANDATAAIALRSNDLAYDDRRRIAGSLIGGISDLAAGLAVLLDQYNHFENRTLAVRGDRLWMGRSRWWDDAGNEAVQLHVIEVGADGLIAYECRLDEDDFGAAYAELDRRYFAGEGAPYAEEGVPLTANAHAENRGDLDRAFRIFSSPGLRVESRSRSVFPARSAAELRDSVEQLGAMVTSYRVWSPVTCWLSKNWIVARHEREAVGRDGEKFSWSRLYAGETHGGRFTSLCEFDVDDEDAAFSYAEERMRAASSRLAVSNQASAVGEALEAAMCALDADRVIEQFSDEFLYDDRRPLSVGSIANLDELRAATERIFSQYNHFESCALAVRGERLSLAWTRWSDDAGNETRYLVVIELGGDGLVHYQARFAEDDFETAYRELEARYYAGEGAAFAQAGARLTEFVTTLNRGDLDTAFGMFGAADRKIESRSRSVFPDRTSTELHDSLEQLRSMVSSVRWWYSALFWLSPEWVVGRQEREATGPDGETYAWTQLYAGGFTGDVVLWACEFEVDDEDAAFAYAEERMRVAPSWLAVSNQASEEAVKVLAALRESDFDAAVSAYADQLVYEDRRRLSGDPIAGRAGLREAHARMREDYNHLEADTLAVRGERLYLARYRLSDDAGNQQTGLIVDEFGQDGRVLYEARFDEEDFDSAYRELEYRYYSGEGREFAEQGRTSLSFLAAMDTLDVEAARSVCAPTFRWVTPPSTLVAQERSLDEFFGWLQKRAEQVSSVKNFGSVIRWLSPSCFVALGDVVARGTDGEEYAWARIYMGEFSNGLLASIREFEDEEAAFAYAEERSQAPTTRLGLANRASTAAQILLGAMQSHDSEAALAIVSDDVCFEDHRRLNGDPLHGKDDASVALQRILAQFSRFELRVLAVRGARLSLFLSKWFDSSGNETAYLHVFEVGEDGRIVTDARFDEDDFNGAFVELESRYYSGEGAAFAVSGKTATEVMVAGNNGDLDKLFGELVTPGFRVESRSGTIFPERTAAELRDSVELFRAMVSSSRTWYSAAQWLSPDCVVTRQEREAVGKDGERYEWSRIYVAEFERGLFSAICEFDVEFEEQAFAYAEERVRAEKTRLSVRNRAIESAERVTSALRAGDIEKLLSCCSASYFLDDRRRFSGDALRGHESLRAGTERVLQHFNRFEMQPLAVRGERFALGLLKWSDDSGNESTHLHVFEVDDDDRIAYEVRFDEDDFEGAYRELEQRYYAGEGAEFAESGHFTTEYVVTMNRGDFDTMFNELTSADLRFENRARSVFAAPSAAELRAHFEDLYATLSSVRSWFSAIRWVSPTMHVGRLEREGVGRDGERFAWTWLLVSQYRDGRLVSICEFDEDDDAVALAYAEEQVRETANPLVVSNEASKTAEAYVNALDAGDLNAAADHAAEDYVLIDRRSFSGDPVRGRAAVRVSIERILMQFNHFQVRTLAVRGAHLALTWSRWTDDAGNESAFFHVIETGPDQRVVSEVRFDEGDFEGAYGEFERRYYAGEGAAFAECGLFAAEYTATMDRGDFDAIFNELTSPEFHFENRGHSLFPNRSARELRASFEDLYTMLAAVRSWFSAVHWVSPTTCVGRFEREGRGQDGEQYAWTRIIVNTYSKGQLASICEFDPDDEAAALGYAEEVARQT